MESKSVPVRGFAIISEYRNSVSVLITVFVDGKPVRFKCWYSNIVDAPHASEVIEIEQKDGLWHYGTVEQEKPLK
jgi:hypothetical protein